MTTRTPVLYHAPQTRGGTTCWMNEELGAPCHVRLVDIRKGDHKTADYLAVNPMGKVPALADGDMIVTEAAAICAYLTDAFPEAGLAPPPGDPLRGTYYRWMFFAPSVIEPTMLDVLSGKERENPGTAGHGAVKDVMTALETAVANGPYLLGEKFSAADVVFGSTLNFGMMFGAIPKEKAFTDYVDRLMARPAAQNANKRNTEFIRELGWE